MADQPVSFSLPNKEMRVGEVLRQSRESAALSISYVAAQIHLQEKVIRALENDQFDQLPGGVFTRGYIRSYAKLLDIDARQLIGAGAEINGHKSVLPAVKKPNKIKSFRVDPVIIWSAVSVMILLAGLLATWWIQQDKRAPVALEAVIERLGDALVNNQGEQNPQPRQNRHYQIGLGGINSEHLSRQQNAAPQIIDDDRPAAMPESTPERPAAVETSAALLAQTRAAPLPGGEINNARIIVRYTEESWTEIFDARKRRLLHGLIKPGATRVISGQAPFDVFLGNSPGVQLEINGKPLDHSAYMRGNNTARFLIDLKRPQ